MVGAVGIAHSLFLICSIQRTYTQLLMCFEHFPEDWTGNHAQVNQKCSRTCTCKCACTCVVGSAFCICLCVVVHAWMPKLCVNGSGIINLAWKWRLSNPGFHLFSTVISQYLQGATCRYCNRDPHGSPSPWMLKSECKMASVQFSSVAQSCLTLCDPMNRSTPGLPVHHQLPEFTQTHVHRVGDAIQSSHPLSSPFPPAPNPSQHQSLFQWVNSSHEVAKVLEFQRQHHSFQRTPRTDLL